MKLSDLVAYRTELEKLSTSHAERTVELELGKIIHLVESQQIQLGNFKTELLGRYSNITNSLDTFKVLVDQLKRDLQEQISITERPWFQESYRLYDEEMCYDTDEYILQRRPILTNDAEKILRSRLQNYTDWKYPGMIIRPGLEKFIDDMVGCDPLYLVDQTHGLLVPSTAPYPEEYKRRLRLYTIKESLDHEILNNIPNDQFGVCLVYNLFNFRPIEIIKKYLIEIFSKLKPGGTLIMTFNDCDRDKAVKLVEQHYACYTPGSLVRELASTIGYKIVFSWDDDGPSTWLELQKPGVLTSLRGGQTLAKVVHKPIAESK